MTTTIALFTRDLRVHDNPMLVAAAAAAKCVVPLFVHDEAIEIARFAAAPAGQVSGCRAGRPGRGPPGRRVGTDRAARPSRG